jgi:pimeloyl-ACP methyl ester carboxylesterase
MDVAFEFEGKSRTIEVTDGSAARPLVVMLHGTGGDVSDMTNPARSPDHNHDYTAPFPPDRSVGWRVYPGIGVWSFELDPKKAVTSWREVLQKNGFRTATYAQVDTTGLLARPVEELAAIMGALTAALPDARFVLLGQSRGGILIRKFLKDHPDRASRVTTVITLHAPHLGSALALAARDVDMLLDDLGQALGSIVDSIFGWLRGIVQSPAFQELAVGSAFLDDLAQNEAPLPGISYFTFGGTSVRFSRILDWVYTLGSAIPQWHWPPFFHAIEMAEVPAISPFADTLPNLVPELTEGLGDLLTADARTRLPFAVHRTNAINHAETLWDERLQDQVLQILGVETGFWS